jgi:hypothetical protein
MSSLVTRRWLWLLALMAASAGAVAAHAYYSPRLPRLAYISGWALFGLMLLLTAYNARKKLPFLPLLSSRTWLEFHVYAGLLTALVFGVHIRGHVPTGPFEIVLATLFVLVTASGIVGLFLSRALPARLTTAGGEVPFERIPSIRHSLKVQAEALALQSAAESRSTILADFYRRRLKEFFEEPRNFWPHVFEVRRPLNRLLQEIGDLNRYLNDKDRAALDQLAALVRQKNGLDYHRALQLVLKGWLFVHIPVTYSLLLVSLAHIVLVYAFSGGAR